MEPQADFDATEARIAADPRFTTLVHDRQRFSWTLAGFTIVVYSCFISLIAFDKPFMARPIGNGTTSIAVVLGFAMLAGTIAICAIYVWRANNEFDRQLEEVLREGQA